MEARFGTIRHAPPPPPRSRGSSKDRDGRSRDPQESFFKREWRQCRATVWKAGSKYNIILSSLLGFVATFAVLLIFRPIFVMTKTEGAKAPIEYEYMTDPQLPPPSDTSDYTISFGALFLWSGLAAGAVALLTHFTCRKPTPQYPVYAYPPSPAK